jgi:hypothetical protein
MKKIVIFSLATVLFVSLSAHLFTIRAKSEVLGETFNCSFNSSSKRIEYELLGGVDKQTYAVLCSASGKIRFFDACQDLTGPADNKDARIECTGKGSGTVTIVFKKNGIEVGRCKMCFCNDKDKNITEIDCDSTCAPCPTPKGDHQMHIGFLEYNGLPYNQPGEDFADAYPGQTLTYTLAPCNSPATYLPAGCKATDTLCFHAVSLHGWTIATNPPMGDLYELPPGYLWYQEVSLTAPFDASVGDKDTLIAMSAYANIDGECAPECGDCHDPNIRPTTGVKYYNADTLIVTVIAAPPALGVLQDTLTLVDRGQTQAFVPFTICNQDECAPPTLYGYNVKNVGVTGRIPVINQTGSVTVDGGACKDVYGIIDAGLALACDYDTLTIIVWTPVPVVYDTCVQVIHVIEPQSVPLFTVPVVTILVLALILAAAVFMRRRAVSRA